MTWPKRKGRAQRLWSGGFKPPQSFVLYFTLLAFVTSVALSLFTAGCPRLKPEAVKVPEPEPNDVEVIEPEPNEVEPTEAEPNEVGPTEAEPNEVQPNEAEPNEVGPIEAEPNEVEPNEVEPNEVETAPRVSFHDKCAEVLNQFVNDEGTVNYKQLKRKKSLLEKVLDEFENLERSEYKVWPQEDKIAFWINAYNLKMLEIIVDNYPIESSRLLRILPTWGPYSIRHIDKNIGGISKQKFYVMDEEFTLGEIERRFFGQEFREPRVFLAICRATLSSPPLRKEPYYGYRLYEQMEDQVRKFLSSPKAFRIDRKDKEVHLTPLFQTTWYGKEFIPKYRTDKRFKSEPAAARAVLNFITNYVSEPDVSFLEREIYSVEYIRYDWTLNDSSRK